MTTINIDGIDFPANTTIEDVMKTLDFVDEVREEEEKVVGPRGFTSKKDVIIESVLITIENRQRRFTEDLMGDVREMMKEI